MANDVGEVLRTSRGSYAAYAHVAAGGFSTVFFGRDLQTNRAVAIKRLHGHLAYQPELVQRFQQEAERLQGLQHPNIVQVLDEGLDSAGLPFIILQWVEGWTVAALLEQRGRFAIDEAVDIACQVLAALEAAGRRGVVHRDIKPANLMLTPPPDGHLKVMDFGIAKDVFADASALNTQVGTIAYMAPEQFSQVGRVDARTDIYALGVTLYELLTGERPMPAVAPPSQTTLRELRPEVDPALAAIVYRALKQFPHERFQTPAEMQAALRPFTRGGSHVAVTDDASLDTLVTPARAPVAAVRVAEQADVRVAERPVAEGRVAEQPVARRIDRRIWIGAGAAALAAVVFGAQQVVSRQAATADVAQSAAPIAAIVGTTAPATLAPAATVVPTTAPTVAATAAPTIPPTAAPTLPPTAAPTIPPTTAPTVLATSVPIVVPPAPPTQAPTAVPTVAPSVDDLWRVRLAEIDPTWSRDWAATIGSLDAFVAAHPAFAEAQEKLYAARLFYAGELLAEDDLDRAVAQLVAANALLPQRPEANAVLVALTPTPEPAPTPRPAVVPATQPKPAAPAPSRSQPPPVAPLRP